MKKLIFTCCLIYCTLSAVAQIPTEKIEKANEFIEKVHKKIALNKEVQPAFRSTQTTTMYLDSVTGETPVVPVTYIYTYNQNDKESVKLTLYDDENGFRTSYTYDSNNRLIQYLEEEWDGSAWMNEFKGVMTYTTEGLVSSDIMSYWSTSENSWSFLGSNFYEYDSEYKLVTDTATTIMVGYAKYKTDYGYDSNDNLTSKLRYTLNADSTTWTANYKCEYTYSSDLLTSALRYTWSGSAWVNAYKVECSYDSNNNLIEFISYSWDGSAWTTENKSQFSYNTSYLLSELAVSEDYKEISLDFVNLSVAYTNMLTEKTTYQETSTDVWTQSSKYVYYYGAASTDGGGSSREEENDSTVTDANNTTLSGVDVKVINGEVVVNGLSQASLVSVYNIQGMEIYSQIVSDEELSLALPTHGVYIVKVGTESVKVLY